MEQVENKTGGKWNKRRKIYLQILNHFRILRQYTRWRCLAALQKNQKRDLMRGDGGGGTSLLVRRAKKTHGRMNKKINKIKYWK